MATIATEAKRSKRSRAESPADRSVRAKGIHMATKVNPSASLTGNNAHTTIKAEDEDAQSANTSTGQTLASNPKANDPKPLGVVPMITSISLGQKARILASYNPQFADLTVRVQGHGWIVHRNIVFPQSAKLQAMCSNKRDDNEMFVVDCSKERHANFVQHLLQMMYLGADPTLTRKAADSVYKLSCIYDLARDLDAFLVMETVLSLMCPLLQTIQWEMPQNQHGFCQIVETLLRSSHSNEPSRSLCVEIIMQRRVALQSSGLLARLMGQDAELSSRLVSVMVGSSEKRAQYYCHSCVATRNQTKAITWKAQRSDAKCISCQAAAYETGLWKGKS